MAGRLLALVGAGFVLVLLLCSPLSVATSTGSGFASVLGMVRSSQSTAAGGPSTTSSAWSQLTTVGGPGLINSAMTWDPQLTAVVLFGGLLGYAKNGSPILSNQTWEFKNSTGWTQLHPSVSPPAREAAVMAYDSTDGYAVLFGGATLVGASGSTTTWTALNDTWTFANSTWTNLTTPVAPEPRDFPRGYAFQVYPWLYHTTSGAFAFNGQGGYGLLLGGLGFVHCVDNYMYANSTCASSSYYHDTWRFDKGRWTDLSPSALSSQIPPTNDVMTYDAHDHYFLAFSYAPKVGPETWKFSNGVWSRVHTHGGLDPNGFFYMTFDWSLGEVVLVANDHSVCSPCSKTFSYSGGSWTLLVQSTLYHGSALAPYGNDYGGALTYDAGTGSLILLTGQAYGGPGFYLPPSNQTWSFS